MVFHCPKDRGWKEYPQYQMPHYYNPILDYGSYVFNGCDNRNNPPSNTLLDISLSSVKHPTRTWMMSEWPIHWAYSWHKNLYGEPDVSYKMRWSMSVWWTATRALSRFTIIWPTATRPSLT